MTDEHKPKLEDHSLNFRGKDGKPFLVYCPMCNKENYSASVATGICCWCGWEAEEDAD